MVKIIKKKAKKIKVLRDLYFLIQPFQEFFRFRYLHDNGIRAGILVRKGSKVKGNPLRDEVVGAIRKGKKR